MRLGLPRWLPLRRARRITIVAAAIVAGYVLLTFFQVLQASGEDNRRPADAIVVLGAAQYDGAPSPVLASRLDHAYELWESGVADMIVTTGSNQPGDRFTEGYAGFEYLLLSGVPESELLVVTDGSSSYEQLAATARQLRGLEIGESVVLVSDPYHALRLRQIADQVGLDATVSSTDGGSSIRQLVRETAAVSLGRILGYRRVDNWLGSVG
ncbi:MAG: YdcF family protein [Acidimicrobiales bacterium]|nr:YdcF family protein [Acidimicrobiales bacterium]